MENIVVSFVSKAWLTNTFDITVSKTLESIRNGKWQKPIEKIRAEVALAIKEGRDYKKAVDGLKKNLRGVLWSGQFCTRVEAVPLHEKLKQHSGLLCADLDHLDDRVEEVRVKLAKSPYMVASFRSPTGTGLKVLFRVQPDPDTHRSSFEAVKSHVMELAGCKIDEACKDVTRLCFVSFDPLLEVKLGATEIPTKAFEYPLKPSSSTNPALQRDRATDATEDTDATDEVRDCVLLPPSGFSPQTFEEVLPYCTPTRGKTNHWHLLIAGRGILTLEVQRGGEKFTKTEKREAFEKWHAAVTQFLNPGQGKEEYWIEFLEACRKAKVPLGQESIHGAWKLAQESPLPPEADKHETKDLQLLIALCYQLQKQAGQEPFYLSSRTFEKLIHHRKSHTTIATWLNYLVEEEKILKIHKKGDEKTKKSTRFFFLSANPLQTGDSLSL